MNQPTVEDLAAMREEGDLLPYLISLTGRTQSKPKTPPVTAAPDPGYRIAHTGGWPIGTAATGPTPTHERCTCPKCEQAAVVELPRPTSQPNQGAA